MSRGSRDRRAIRESITAGERIGRRGNGHAGSNRGNGVKPNGFTDVNLGNGQLTDAETLRLYVESAELHELMERCSLDVFSAMRRVAWRRRITDER